MKLENMSVAMIFEEYVVPIDIIIQYHDFSNKTLGPQNSKLVYAHSTECQCYLIRLMSELTDLELLMCKRKQYE